MKSLGAALAADLDAAFPKLVAATQDRVYSLALAMTANPHDAQDVAQEAYLRGYRALRTYPAQRRRALLVRPWLAKIALNVWRNRVRGGRGREVPVGDDTLLEPAGRRDPELERLHGDGELRSLVATLPPRYRSAVVLRHVLGMPYAEAASALGIPVGTLKANVHRGLLLLRRAWESRYKDRR